MLRTIYRQLPIPKAVKPWLKEKLPLAWQRQKQFRRYGSINELYVWRLDQGIDTVAPIQNYFSSLFPELDTTTKGQAWIFNGDGEEIASHEFELPVNGMHQLRVSEHIAPGSKCGTFMWHIRMPDSVANLDVVRKNLIYFTDRGYICYEKDRRQPAFIHGVDRYAVFQEQSMHSSELFYERAEGTHDWTPEFPIQGGMQSGIDVMLLNRSKVKCECLITIFRNGGIKVFETTQKLMPRGVAILPLGEDILAQLQDSGGYFKVSGLTSQWGRPAITRHYSCGAISVMHC